MKISLTIKKICKKLDITYKSVKENFINGYKDDIQSLADIYIQLKSIIVKLQEIEEEKEIDLKLKEHPIDYYSILEFKKMIHQTVQHLENIDHEIKKSATKLLRIKKEK